MGIRKKFETDIDVDEILSIAWYDSQKNYADKHTLEHEYNITDDQWSKIDLRVIATIVTKDIG